MNNVRFTSGPDATDANYGGICPKCGGTRPMFCGCPPQDLAGAVQAMNDLPDISGGDSQQLRRFCEATAREIKTVGGVSAGTSLEMIGYIRELEAKLRTPSTTSPSRTEQARQLVNAWACDWNIRNELAKGHLVEAVASFAAEAATQGQLAGIERAVEVGKHYEAFYKERLANVANEVTAEKVRHHKDAYARMAGAVSQATKEIATLSPDPSFLDRVRNEAAIAALEQAAQIAEKQAGKHRTIGDTKAIAQKIRALETRCRHRRRQG